MRPDITVQFPGSKLSIELLPSPTSPIDSGVSWEMNCTTS